ncbi:MAG: hypothetical protein AAF518_03985 [Spirochaetota bacterium]
MRHITYLLVFACTLPLAAQSSQGRKKALAACKNHRTGQKCTLQASGKSASGICHNRKGQEICIPVVMDKIRLKRQLPQEAYAACTGKRLRQNCTISKFFMTAKGKCHTRNGRKVCIPLQLRN